jgi:hypothetical protein
MTLPEAFARYADDLAARLLRQFQRYAVVTPANDNRKAS